MKSKLKIASLSIAAALLGVFSGAMDQVQHDRQANAQLNVLCESQPSLGQCKKRESVAKSIRYTFNGQEFRNGTPVSAFGANE